MPKTAAEDQVKNILKRDYLDAYDWTPVLGDIDLAVASQPRIGEQQIYYLWAETKKGSKSDIYESLVQLILTIGKAKTYEVHLPPYFLGAADAEKIAFVDYSNIMHVFTKTDFNWNVTPSNHATKEFRELYTLLHDDLASDVVVFKYAFDSDTLRKFIKKNFREGRKGTAKIPINKNNFTYVYYDWVRCVKSSIRFDWDKAQKKVLDRDFFLADLMSEDNKTIIEKLKIVLEKTAYRVKVRSEGMFEDLFSEVGFKDGMVAHKQFWNRYIRPPKPVYQRYILDRADLLVPQDIREVKGSYYTPAIWVQKAQEYIEKVLGEDWQDEYFVWDCAAGSGNLLRGLTNKYNIFASTLDDSDVRIMHNAIENGTLNLVKENVFQFDFLNDDFSKCPKKLQEIIADGEQRKKLVLLINSPYAEPTNAKAVTGTGKHRKHLYVTEVQKKYENVVGLGIKELFAQFAFRIYKEIPGCVLAEFSTLKILQAPNFKEFRKNFTPSLKSCFLVPSNTFDNVKGKFPIGFKIWKTSETEPFVSTEADVFDEKGELLGTKTIAQHDNKKYIIDWLRLYYDKVNPPIGYLKLIGTDVQHNRYIYISNYLSPNDIVKHLYTPVTKNNVIEASIYYAVRNIVEDTWQNDRDQYLMPNHDVITDNTFRFDCLVYTLFNVIIKGEQIPEEDEIRIGNFWIPYYEAEVNAPAPFSSRFMADFIHGKIKRETQPLETGSLFSEIEAKEAAATAPIDAMSEEAQRVYDAGRELWKYYMSKNDANANASLYDIKGYFQGFSTNDKGKLRMNADSPDPQYADLVATLRSALKELALHIEPKIYEYGFLKK